MVFARGRAQRPTRPVRQLPDVRHQATDMLSALRPYQTPDCQNPVALAKLSIRITLTNDAGQHIWGQHSVALAHPWALQTGNGAAHAYQKSATPRWELAHRPASAGKMLGRMISFNQCITHSPTKFDPGDRRVSPSYPLLQPRLPPLPWQLRRICKGRTPAGQAHTRIPGRTGTCALLDSDRAAARRLAWLHEECA